MWPIAVAYCPFLKCTCTCTCMYVDLNHTFTILHVIYTTVMTWQRYIVIHVCLIVPSMQRNGIMTYSVIAMIQHWTIIVRYDTNNAYHVKENTG